MSPAPLDIWLYGVRVAELTEQRSGKLRLTYTAEAQSRWRPGTPLLSISMPVQLAAHPHSVAGPWVEGLLPEGEARTVLEGRHGLRRGDTFGLLRAIGLDCAGAVQFVPSGAPVPPVTSDSDYEEIDVQALVDELPDRPLGDGGRVRVSLAGQQPKLLLVRRPDGGWSQPVDGTPSTHILKPADGRFPGIVHNEALCLRMARHLGLTTIEVETTSVGDHDALVVSRYDRHTSEDGTTRRIHQEDLCQALSIPTTAAGGHKYEAEGGPGLAQVAEAIDRHNGSTEQLVALARAMTLNVALGNADAHGKNFSLLLPSQGPPTLAPLYDLLSITHWTHVDGRPLDHRLAMAVAGKRDAVAVTRDDLITEVVRWGLVGAAVAESAVDQTIAALPEALQAAATQAASTADAVIDHVGQRITQLLQS